MSLNSPHRPSRKKEQRAWYENALLIAISGSVIVVIGQLAGTVIPIMYGPQDASDFSININPINYYAHLDNGSPYEDLNILVNANDFHSFLRPYKFKIFLRATGAPESVQNIKFYPHEINAGKTSYMHITINKTEWGDFPIIIQGIGADGRTRNATFYLTVSPFRVFA